VTEAARQLACIGYDRVVGFFDDGWEGWSALDHDQP